MTVISWIANVQYQLGDIRRASTAQVTGLFFKCTTAGTSANSEPSWPTDIGSTVTDNTVVWTAISSVYADLSVLNPNAIIELFEIRLDPDLHGSTEVIEFHNGCNADLTGGIVWNGVTYSSMAIKAEGFEKVASGVLPRPTLSIANTSGSISALLNDVNVVTAGNDLTGTEVRRIKTLKKFLDGESTADPHAQWPVEIWYIDRKAVENRDIVTFELASKFDLIGQKLPKRQIVANVCQWKYRSSECSYSGAGAWDINDSPTAANADQCGKRISSCKLRFGENAQLPFGSFPSAGRIR